jgi:hypothetical protein
MNKVDWLLTEQGETDVFMLGYDEKNRKWCYLSYPKDEDPNPTELYKSMLVLDKKAMYTHLKRFYLFSEDELQVEFAEQAMNLLEEKP